MRKIKLLVIGVAIIVSGAVAVGLDYNNPNDNSNNILRNDDIVSYSLKNSDLESYKVTYFKGGKVFVKVAPKIYTKKDLLEYLEKRKKTVSYLSTMQPDRVVDVTITFNRKCSVEEYSAFLQKYGLKPTSYMYKSYPEGVGVFSAQIPEELIKGMEGQIKEKYNDFRLIDSVISFKTRVLAKDLVKLQKDSMVLMVDPGPVEVYVENSDAKIFVTVDYFYPSYVYSKQIN
jgi:hypothetical protein